MGATRTFHHSIARFALTVALVLGVVASAAPPAPTQAATSGLLKGTVTAPAGLNMRKKPDLTAPIIRDLPHGTRMVILGSNGDWFKVSVGGKTGYVSSWYVTLQGRASKVITRGNTSRKMVALTFDAGSDLGYTTQILTILEEYGITASFGLTGSWMSAYPGYAAWIVADGHQVLNHTLSHPSFTGYSTGTNALSPARQYAQIVTGEKRIGAFTGGMAKPYWRAPYGDYDSNVLHIAGALGYSKTVMWSIDSMGWAGYTTNQIYQKVVNNAGNGSIILMHVGAASRDVFALERIIQTLRARGYTFGTVAQVIA